MSLSCENSAKVILKYTSIIPNKIEYSGKKFSDRSVRLGDYPYIRPLDPGAGDVFFIYAPNLDTEITWDFELDPVRSWYRYPVKVVHAGTKNDPSTTTYDAFFPGNITDIGFWFNENGGVYWRIGELDQPETTNWVKPGWIKVDSPINRTTNREILDISIGEGEVHYPFAYAWKMKIYFDGQYIGQRIVRSSTATPPNNDVYILEGQPGNEITKDFILPDIPKKVELKQVEGSEYSWQLIKVLGEQEEEILLFSGIDPELLCFAEEGAGFY